MTDLTNFTDTSDVSDAAIEWVLRLDGDQSPALSVRKNSVAVWARRVIIAARLIQQHRPDLLVDPVDAIVREEMAKAYEAAGMPGTAIGFRKGEGSETSTFQAAKRLYLMGIEKGKGA